MAQHAVSSPSVTVDRLRYAAIADHGLIGDLQTSALVAVDGTVDWFCCPRFDSPSVFASLLDHDRGGYFRIGPATECVPRQLYFPSSAVLVTRFMTADGVGEVVDFMPIHDARQPSDHHRLVRVLRVVRGTLRFVLECAPRFDYGRAAHELEVRDSGAVFHSPHLRLTLHSTIGLQQTGGDVRAEVTLREGQAAGVILESGSDAPPRAPARDELLQMLDETIGHWRAWLRRSTYTGRWREIVERSAMTLRLMTYAPTGALVAAPTAGVPEQVGGERNWDYRFTWVRDASFSIYALLGLGFEDEAVSFVRWLSDRVIDQAGESSGPLKIMYRVDGGTDLTEEVLSHFEGYRGSRPVRIGNGASDQLQLDIYGELMDSLYQADRHGLRIGHPGWVQLRKIMDWLSANWDQPDEGIWETRGGRQNFTYGRLMSWVALDRTVRLARERGLPADLNRLVLERDRIYEQLIERGWNARKRAYVQHYDTDVVDASVLLMPLVGFASPIDPMWRSTLRAVDQELVSDSLVYRYDPSASPDGLRGSEGTFSICTFWYVDALARSGRVEEARLVFEKMLTYANPLGLLSEEIGLTGEQLGNFPQAFSHLALINAAVNLDHQLNRAAAGVTWGGLPGRVSDGAG
ncbi:MAG: glycoside hydrolase family 15 protein [Candidatus Dormibacteraeota bacterium]|nr:glycoside hydrolase family 15 protein [Candidatus Dormibacteraeota bacterium]